jgi:CheY-like chemotaxis protein
MRKAVQPGGSGASARGDERFGREECRTQDNLKYMDSSRVLVVEDDSAIRQGIIDALKFAGYDVIQARNGNEGLAEALRANFDLLLLDLILPGVGGFEILQATRQARPTLPVIILTARGVPVR